MKQRTDPVGRTIAVGVVTKGQYGWMIPVDFQLYGVDTHFTRLPHGHFGVQVASKEGAEVLVFVEGKQVLSTTVPGGIHILEYDAQGRPFAFLPTGESQSPTIETDQPAATAPPVEFASDEAASESDQSSEPGSAASTPAPAIPDGPGALFVVARFVDDPGPGLKPPRIEWPFTFALGAPDDHDAFLAANFSRLVRVESGGDFDKPTDENPDHDHSPTPITVCLTCGRH